jgi:hypothetical protein
MITQAQDTEYCVDSTVCNLPREISYTSIPRSPRIMASEASIVVYQAISSSQSYQLNFDESTNQRININININISALTRTDKEDGKSFVFPIRRVPARPRRISFDFSYFSSSSSFSSFSYFSSFPSQSSLPETRPSMCPPYPSSPPRLLALSPVALTPPRRSLDSKQGILLSS